MRCKWHRLSEDNFDACEFILSRLYPASTKDRKLGKDEKLLNFLIDVGLTDMLFANTSVSSSHKHCKDHIFSVRM